MSSEAKNLEAIVKAIEEHDSKCKSKAKAVLMCPFEIERLGWTEIKGIPIKPDETLGTGRFRLVCDGYHGPKKENEVEETVEAPAPAERELVPAGVPEEDGGIFGKINMPEGWRIWSEPLSSNPEADLRAWMASAYRQRGMP